MCHAFVSLGILPKVPDVLDNLRVPVHGSLCLNRVRRKHHRESYEYALLCLLVDLRLHSGHRQSRRRQHSILPRCVFPHGSWHAILSAQPQGFLFRR